jgi:glycosyltransferase involved in cell wall biosynthesis
VKNFATALSAYALLRQRFRDTPPLVLAGGQKHTHHAELRALVADHGIEDHVRFLEFQSPNDLLQLYNGARLLLHPSFHEGFSLTILEAMACGLPIIASSNTSIPEAAGDAALYVEDPNDGEAFADHLQKVMSDDELAATLSRRALDRVSRFSWRRCVRETLALYGRFG